MKKIYASQISDYIAIEIEDEFYVKEAEIKQTTESGTTYLYLKLEDKSGSINGRIWENNLENNYIQLKGKIVVVNGEVILDTNRNPEFIIWKMRPITEYDIHQFIKGLSNSETKKYIQTLNKQINLVKHIGYNSLLNTIYEKNIDMIKNTPASINHVGNYNGGLLVQTVAVTSIAIQIMRSQILFSYTPERAVEYQEDLLITGALLFGIGIIDLYTTFPEARKKSESILLSKPLLTIQRIYKSFPEFMTILTEEESNLLIHMIHTTYDSHKFRPMNKESLILSLAYQAYCRIGHLDNIINRNPDGKGAIYDTASKNYFYISKDFTNGGLNDEPA